MLVLGNDVESTGLLSAVFSTTVVCRKVLLGASMRKSAPATSTREARSSRASAEMSEYAGMHLR